MDDNDYIHQLNEQELRNTNATLLTQVERLNEMLQIMWNTIHGHYLSNEFTHGTSIYKNFANVRLWATTGVIAEDPAGNYQVRPELADYADNRRPELKSPPKWWSAGT